MKIDSRDKYIFEQLNRHYEEAKKLGYEIFALVLQGSQNYGLDIYNDEYKSDIDSKLIVLPTLDDLIEERKPISYTHVLDNDEHIDVKDIRIMWDCFKKQNVNFIEILFSDYYIVPNQYIEYWERLRAMAEDLTHINPIQTVKCLFGMSMQKYEALKHPYPTIKWKIDKWGYDGKQLHHVIRINDFIKRYVKGEEFKSCLYPSQGILKDLEDAKLNRYSLKKAEDIAYTMMNETKFIKDSFIQNNSECDTSQFYHNLDNIRFNVMRDFLKRAVTEM